MRTQDSDSSAGETALRRGIAAARAGLRSVAAAQFERAAETMPDNANVWLWLAWMGNSPDNTIRCLEQVLELSPGHAVAAAGLMWARALASDAPIPPVDIPEASPIVIQIAPVESVEPKMESAVQEAFASPEVTPDIASEMPTEVSPVVAIELPPNAPEPEPFEVTTAMDTEAAPEETPEKTEDFSLWNSQRRRWNDLVLRDPESPTDATAWPSLVPPPLPSLVPPPLPTATAPVPVEPESITRFQFREPIENRVTTPSFAAIEPDHSHESATEVETLTTSFHPTTEIVSSDGRPLVMVVDDSPTVRKLVSLTLERRGYRVISAFDGVAAIKELGSCRPDLILLDINMPRLDGYRLCKLIKKHEATQTIPVVMLSGKDGMFDKLRGRLVGCSDYITKPFEADALTHKVARYLTPTSSPL